MSIDGHIVPESREQTEWCRKWGNSDQGRRCGGLWWKRLLASWWIKGGREEETCNPIAPSRESHSDLFQVGSCFYGGIFKSKKEVKEAQT